MKKVETQLDLTRMKVKEYEHKILEVKKYHKISVDKLQDRHNNKHKKISYKDKEINNLYNSLKTPMRKEIEHKN